MHLPDDDASGPRSAQGPAMPATLPATESPVTHPVPADVLLLPGWQNSGPQHWQSRWEQRHGFQRVQQADWDWPRQGDWMAALEEAVLARLPAAGDEPAGPPAETRRPLVLAAHSLGCLLVAAWAAHSRLASRVTGALLVAPPDITREDMPPQLYSWRRPSLLPLPFASHLVASDDDPYGSVGQAQRFAQAWGSRFTCVGPAGHLNADSGLGDWPQGLRWLSELALAPAPGTPG